MERSPAILQSPPDPPATSATSLDAVEVMGLDPAGTLAFTVAAQRAEHLAGARRIRGACHWADLHRTEGLGAVDEEVRRSLLNTHGLGIYDSVLGAEGELRLAREGAFRVAEFALTELAVALGMSEPGARAYVGQCLELRDRLPRLWHQTMAGVLPPWKALLVARDTLALNADAAGYVDGHLAPFAHQLSFVRITRAVEAAIERHDPEQARKRAEQAAEKRGVWVEDHVDGTSRVSAVTDTPGAAAFDTALSAVATTLGVLGDTDPHQVRRAKALGVLADPQGTLDLHTQAQAQAVDPASLVEGSAAVVEEGDEGPAPVEEGDEGARLETTTPTGTRPRTSGPVLHLHLHTAAVGATGFTGVAEHGVEPVARVQGYGPRPAAAITRWLADLAPNASVVVTPVVDLAESIAVDAYEIPDRLRRLVAERDHTGCQFPWCGRQGRYDLDHITPYVPFEDGGAPRQTSDRNLARLCRFHHRVKTRGGWVYHRTPVGDLEWTSPLGWRYAVDVNGTRPLTLINIDDD